MISQQREPDVNDLPLSMVNQWQEYRTTRSFAASVPVAPHRELADNPPLRAAEPASHKAFAPVVQTMTRPHQWFKRVALDGKWQYVYADHIRFLTKKRHRVDGVRVQGYTADGLKVEVLQ